MELSLFIKALIKPTKNLMKFFMKNHQSRTNCKARY
jgi:hypothetical protein